MNLPERTEAMLRQFSAEHDELRDALSLLRDTADLLTTDSPDALTALRRANTFLVERLLPHEQAEESQLYPALVRPLGSAEATAPMSRTHAEIQRLSGRIAVHLDIAQAAGGLTGDQTDDLLACLYGLYAVLRLHFTQEEENYFTLAAG